jgi:uncharacterized protein
MPFARYEYRTTDVDQARAFYVGLLAQGLPDVTLVSDESLKRGARPHWRVHLAVSDVDAAVSAFVTAGGTRLGDGGLRDPSGAVLSLTQTPSSARADVALVLHLGAPKVRPLYANIAGWLLGPVSGPHQPFSLADGDPAVGIFADRAAYPLAHPQWLVAFAVASLDTALAFVRAHGGQTQAPVDAGDGAMMAVCDDPQGAAFALYMHRQT